MKVMNIPYKSFINELVLFTLALLVPNSAQAITAQSLSKDSKYLLSIDIEDSGALEQLNGLSLKFIHKGEKSASVVVNDSMLQAMLTQGISYNIDKIINGNILDNPLFESANTASLTLKNEFLTVPINDDGTFTMYRSTDEKWLLYPRAGTGFFSVKVDNSIYSQKDGSLTLSEPLTMVSTNEARIVYAVSENIQIIQTFRLEGESLGLYVAVENGSTVDHNVQIRYLLDTQIDINDGSPLWAPSLGVRTFESDIPIVNFIDWEAWLTPRNPDMKGIGNLTDKPSRIVFAWWPSAKNSTWEYTPNPSQRFYTAGYTSSPESDGCVLLYYDFGLVPGNFSTNSISTFYGIGGRSSGVPSTKLKDAIQQLRDAVYDYVNETASSYAYHSSFSYEVFATETRTKNWVRDITESLLTEDVNEVEKIIKLFKSNNLLNGSELAFRIFLENLFKVALKKIIPTMVTSLNDINNNDSAVDIEQKILNNIYGPDGWDFGLGTRGINSLLNEITSLANIPIPAELPEGFPVDDIIRALRNLTSAIRKGTPELNSLANESFSYWIIPGESELNPFPLDNYLAGSSSSTLKGLRSAVAGYNALGQIDQIFTYAEITNDIIKVGTLLATPITAGTSNAYEGIYNTLGGLLSTGAIITDAFTILQQISVAVQQFDALAKVKSDLEKITDIYKNALTDVEAVVADPTLFNTRFNYSRSIAASNFIIPDLQLGLGENIGSANARVTATNLSNDKNATALAVMSVYGSSNDPIGIFHSAPVTLGTGGETILEIPFEVPKSGYFGVDRYIAVLNLLTSQGIKSSVGQFRVCGTVGCFIDDITNVISTELSPGGVASETTEIVGNTRSAEFVMIYPGSDFDLHIYDPAGNHVGVDYSSGNVDLQIPGARYTGAGTNPERIVIDQPTAGIYRVEVVNISSETPENCEVVLFQEPEHPATLFIPQDSIIIMGMNTQESLSGNLMLREIGGHNAINQLSFFATDLISSQNDLIASSNISFEPEVGTIPADSTLNVTINISLNSDLNSGDYFGEIRTNSLANDNTIPIRISLQTSSPPVITTVSPSSASAGQTLDIVIQGNNFQYGATVSFNETGIITNSTTYISQNELRTNITISPAVPEGSYDLTITNPDAQSTVATGLFSVVACRATTSYSNDFEAGDVTGFRPLTPSSWAVQPTGTGNKTYCITNANLNGDEYSTIPGEPWTDFTLSLSAKAGGANNKNFFILFGVPDFNNATRNGYYLQFAFGGIKLYRTINDVGSLIGSHPMNLMSEDIFHDIKVERNGANIKVIAKNQVVIDINDNYFPSGYIGFGSYKNTACFDALSINGGGASSGLFNDNFEDGVADGWTPLTPSRWSVTLENGSMRYFLNTTNYNSPDGSRPGEYSLIDNSDYGDFTFECLAKSADAAIGSTFPDLGIVFGYQDDKNFYFAMFNGQATETSIDRYVNGVRTRLVMYNNPTFSDGNYHSLRVEREGTIIKTYFDGTLILTADDGTFRSGKIGVGSFNDSGYFDDITISTCESPVIAPLTNISLPPNSQIPAGSILSIPITISTDKLIGVAQFTVDYLSTVINFVSASIGPDAPGFTISQINTTPTFPPVTGGTDRNVIVQMNGGATGTFTGEKKVIMYLNFQAVGTPGSKSVLAINPECNKTFLSTTDFIDICGSDISFEKGSVTIVSGTEVSGTVSYYNSQPVSDAIINLSGPASKKDTTDTSGQYRIVDFPSGTYNLYAEKTGDRRSAISGSDALAVLQAAGFARTLTPDQIIAADVNESGDVTGADAVAILRYLAFLNTGTANVGTWKFIPGSLSITIFGKQQQDYTAYLLGDVTGNWGITNSAGVAKQTVSADILTGKAYIQDGLLRVPLQLSSDGDAVYSGRIRIDWNFEDASGVDFVPSNKDIHFAINSQKAGMTHIAFVSLEGLKAGETIGELTTRFSNVKSNKNNVLGEVAYSELNDVEKPAKQQIFLDKATSNIPEDITLLPNYPNPFNLGTTIRFGIPESTEPVNTQLTIYSIDGKVIRTLVNEELRAGYHSRVWNGLDQSGKTVSSGVYIYLLKSGTKQASAKLLIVK